VAAFIVIAAALSKALQILPVDQNVFARGLSFELAALG
jgi:hypothetical protein